MLYIESENFSEFSRGKYTHGNAIPGHSTKLDDTGHFAGDNYLEEIKTQSHVAKDSWIIRAEGHTDPIVDEDGKWVHGHG